MTNEPTELTTEEVRFAVGWDHWNDEADPDRAEQFDRWLANVRAEALEEAAAALEKPQYVDIVLRVPDVSNSLRLRAGIVREGKTVN